MSGPLYVGAARNIGVAASRVPYLAFLAKDCLARAGWVAGRLSQHHAGAQAVAPAVVGEGDASLVALAANRLCYASRHPNADPRHLSFYGQSCARTHLRQLGHFPSGLRVGEDTALNQRLALAQDLLSRDTSLTRADRRAVLALQWLATWADRHDTLQGLAQIARAEGLAVQATAAADPGLARQACALDQQDAEKAVPLADLLRHSADLPGARVAFAAALAVDPAHRVGAEGLVAVVSALDGLSAAWQQAEALVYAAPTMRRLWSIAVEAALAANHPAWAVGLGQVALARGVDVASGHAMLARLHKAAGDRVA